MKRELSLLEPLARGERCLRGFLRVGGGAGNIGLRGIGIAGVELGVRLFHFVARLLSEAAAADSAAGRAVRGAACCAGAMQHSTATVQSVRNVAAARMIYFLA